MTSVTGPAVDATPATLLTRHPADPARVFAVVEDDAGQAKVVTPLASRVFSAGICDSPKTTMIMAYGA